MIDHIIRWLPSLTDAALTALEVAIGLERSRRDVCSHGVRCGNYCPECREEYRLARREAGHDD